MLLQVGVSGTLSLNQDDVLFVPPVHTRAHTHTRTHTQAYTYTHTHIHAGLEDWATDLVYLTNGKIELSSDLASVQALTVLRQRGVPAPLFRLDSKFIHSDLTKNASKFY